MPAKQPNFFPTRVQIGLLDIILAASSVARKNVFFFSTQSASQPCRYRVYLPSFLPASYSFLFPCLLACQIGRKVEREKHFLPERINDGDPHNSTTFTSRGERKKKISLAFRRHTCLKKRTNISRSLGKEKKREKNRNISYAISMMSFF